MAEEFTRATPKFLMSSPARPEGQQVKATKDQFTYGVIILGLRPGAQAAMETQAFAASQS